MTMPVPDFDTFDGARYDARENPEDAVAATEALLKADSTSGAPTIASAPETHCRLEQGIWDDGRDRFERDAEVRELSGEDEEALARCGTNAAKIMDTLILRGVRTIGAQFMSRGVADDLLIGDREHLILAIRRATFGDHVDFQGLPCPHCGEHSDVQYALDDVPVRRLTDPEQTEFEVQLRHGANAYVRLPNGADQNAIQELPGKPTDAVANTAMLSRCLLRVEYRDRDTVKGSEKVARALSMGDRDTLMRFLIETQPGPRFGDCSFTHDLCGMEVPLPLNLAMLFR